MFSAVDEQPEFTVSSGVNPIANRVGNTEGFLGNWRETVIHHLDWERAGFRPKGESQVDVLEEAPRTCSSVVRAVCCSPKVSQEKRKEIVGSVGEVAHPGARELEAECPVRTNSHRGQRIGLGDGWWWIKLFLPQLTTVNIKTL